MTEVIENTDTSYKARLTTIVYTRNPKDMTARFFLDRGFEVTEVTAEEVKAQPVILGNPIYCGDDRDTHDNAFHVLGALDGVAAHVQEEKIEDRFKIAAELVSSSGFEPLRHGDNKQGDIDGCALRKAWMDGFLTGLPYYSRRTAWALRFLHDINHLKYRGAHQASRLALNFTEGVALKPGGWAYVHNIGYLRQLGFDLQKEILPLLGQVVPLLLPDKEKREIVIF